MNYERAIRVQDELRSHPWDVLIIDEGHQLKNPEAQRTVALLGRPAKRAKKDARTGKVTREALEAIPPIQATFVAWLTGTPIPNRTREGWTCFNYLGPEVFGNFWKFATRYCDAHQTRFGWDLDGSSHSDELQELLRETFMVRRLKSDVLKELPPKRRQIVEVEADDDSWRPCDDESASWDRWNDRLERRAAEVELAKAGTDDEYRAAVGHLVADSEVAFVEFAEMRHRAALAKVPAVVQLALEALEDGGKLVTFAHHRDVLDAIAAGVRAELGARAVVQVDGRNTIEERQAAVDAFQRDSEVRHFVGGIRAAGVGLTLTASSRVDVAELDPVPGVMSQAEDRCHRIGQHDSVTVRHIVLAGSPDARIAKLLVGKQEIIERVLDRETHNELLDVPLAGSCIASTFDVKREQVAREAETMTPAQVAAVHLALRTLAGFDPDHARQVNGIGFNRLDGSIGHSLASAPELTPRQAALGRRIVRKYARQLGAEVLTAAGCAAFDK